MMILFEVAKSGPAFDIPLVPCARETGDDKGTDDVTVDTAAAEGCNCEADASASHVAAAVVRCKAILFCGVAE